MYMKQLIYLNTIMEADRLIRHANVYYPLALHAGYALVAVGDCWIRFTIRNGVGKTRRLRTVL
jgi:hypothetical protein